MKLSLIIIPTMIACTGCSGGITSVDPNANTDALSASQSSELCEDVQRYLSDSFSPTDLARLGCAVVGTDECPSAFEDCVAKAEPLPLVLECASFESTLSQCNTTVGEYTKCLQQFVQMEKTIESQLPFCSTAAEEQAGISALGQLSTDCLALMQSCPPVL